MSIEWIEQGKRFPAKPKCDVRVAKVFIKGKPHTRIAFYKGVYKRITDSDYIKIGTAKDRIYFDTARSGFKLRKFGTDPNTKMVMISRDMEGFYGDYNLQFDGYENCNCITKRNKKVD